MPPVSHVHADLVCAPGFDLYAEQGAVIVLPQYPVAGHGIGSVVPDHAAYFLLILPADRRFNNSLGLPEHPGGKGEIFFFRRRYPALAGKQRTGRPALSECNHAACVLVEPSHRPYFMRVPAAQIISCQIIAQRIPEVPVRRVYHDAGRFVQADEILILIEYLDRPVCGNRLSGKLIVQPDRQDISRSELPAHKRRFSVYFDASRRPVLGPGHIMSNQMKHPVYNIPHGTAVIFR